jgi:hypothetical protein
VEATRILADYQGLSVVYQLEISSMNLLLDDKRRFHWEDFLREFWVSLSIAKNGVEATRIFAGYKVCHVTDQL